MANTRQHCPRAAWVFCHTCYTDKHARIRTRTCYACHKHASARKSKSSPIKCSSRAAAAAAAICVCVAVGVCVGWWMVNGDGCVCVCVVGGWVSARVCLRLRLTGTPPILRHGELASGPDRSCGSGAGGGTASSRSYLNFAPPINEESEPC